MSGNYNGFLFAREYLQGGTSLFPLLLRGDFTGEEVEAVDIGSPAGSNAPLTSLNPVRG